jgi:hypothetical protein
MEYLASTPSFKITYCRSNVTSNLLYGLDWLRRRGWGNSCSRRLTSGTLMLYYKEHIMWKSTLSQWQRQSTIRI